MKFLDKYTDHAYALLRIMSGLMFVQHGTQKFFDFPKEGPGELAPMMLGAATIEVIGGVLIAIGLFTRPAAFIASGMSAVGYWMFHAPGGFYPINNGGELIALYCFAFLFIATKGAGIWSVDAAMAKPDAE
ncbi:DoxX family protein [Aurantiacibacter sp. D1-12]|uniref:DoxX family protein n=1 Tax=Aurantiacibacter sp. D1-12 TaxID=2993658 RepID=UPI00237CE467|nr:DoxX family protein [Aurantiacibacter sp. D1-12]MDE1466971.1 DoxX family protein [Aurantiacibacter sp. D1-12]